MTTEHATVINLVFGVFLVEDTTATRRWWLGVNLAVYATPVSLAYRGLAVLTRWVGVLGNLLTASVTLFDA